MHACVYTTGALRFNLREGIIEPLRRRQVTTLWRLRELRGAIFFLNVTISSRNRNVCALLAAHFTATYFTTDRFYFTQSREEKV